MEPEVKVMVGSKAEGLRQQLADGAFIVLGRHSAEWAAEMVRSGLTAFIIPVKSARDLDQLPDAIMAYCVLLFQHNGPWKSASPAINDQIEAWKRSLMSGIDLGTPAPAIEFLLAANSSETTLQLQWSSPVGSQRCIQVARQLEESCVRHGGAL